VGQHEAAGTVTELGAQFPVFLAEEELNGVAGIAAMNPGAGDLFIETGIRRPGRCVE